ncbi:MAG: coproporphyrinogen dehydrogenase HemZ [Eubacteriaceae bacterium]|nr:coproporphyrinogen dehydrogenase HemZ [Eubacteriaceae bacterium]
MENRSGNIINMEVKGTAYANDLRELLMQFFPDFKLTTQKKTESKYSVLVNYEDSLFTCILQEIFRQSERILYKENTIITEDVRRNMKLKIYQALHTVTGKELKWGILTGIRPGRIPHKMLLEGFSSSETIEKLKSDYMLREDAARMITDIAALEIDCLYPLNIKKLGIYIGIPFCPTRCSYCSFITQDSKPGSAEINAYVESLIYEIKSVGGFLRENDFVVETIYIGGGTPAILDDVQLIKLLKAVDEHIDRSAVLEYTFEAGRPDAIRLEALETIKAFNIDRISVNPQSLKNETLVKIGRNHTKEDFMDALKMARSMKFKTINCDMILGLEDETQEDMIKTAKGLVNLKPENITVHSLSMKRSSEINSAGAKHTDEAENEVRKAGEKINRLLDEAGYYPYYLYRQKYTVNNGENTGYCVQGHESLYNIGIMSHKRTIVGLGAGSTGKIFFPQEDRFERMETVKNTRIYSEKILEIAEYKIDLLKTLL